MVNCCLKQTVVLHGTLHRFRERWGTGPSTVQAKLVQQLAGLAHKPIFQLFLDVRKAYKSLDRGRCLEILRGYGLVMNLAHLFTYYWEQQRTVPKAGNFLEKDFRTGRELTQGNPYFPIIFKIMKMYWQGRCLMSSAEPRRHNMDWDRRWGRETWCFMLVVAVWLGGTTSECRMHWQRQWQCSAGGTRHQPRYVYGFV